MKQFFFSSIFFLVLLQAVLAINLTPAQKKAMIPPPNECLLWFGKQPAPYKDMNDFLDNNYIKSNGGTSVVNLLIKAGIPIPKGIHPTFWNEVSRLFASQSKGQVRLLQGPLTRPYKDTVFYNDELPELTKPGSAVTEIIAIDAANPSITRVIWKKGGKHWGKGGKDEASTPKEIFDVPTSGCSPLAKRALNGACPMPASRKGATSSKTSKASVKTSGKTGNKKVPARKAGRTGTGSANKVGVNRQTSARVPNKKATKPIRQAASRKVRRSGPSRLAADQAWDSL